jgi:hypothetical protein
MRAVRRTALAVEILEDRWVPSGFSSITSNFNGTAIPAGDTVWFSSAFKVSGLGSSAVSLNVTNQAISFTAHGTPYTVAVPDSHITISPDATSATTTFDAANNAWDTTLPKSFSGNAFLGGVALPVPGGLPGGINPVTWSAHFSSDTGGVSLNWQWSAAVYSQFGTDLTTLGVKPVDDNHVSAYQNSDHAGTPEAFKAFVIGGARGGGGSNFTGSLSATASISPTVNVPPPPALTGSLSGIATNAGTHAAFAGVIITLTGTDVGGNSVTQVTTTGADGSYRFTGLAAGTYTLTATIPSGYVDGGDLVGTVNGSPDGTRVMAAQLGGIVLNTGDNGINYDFSFFNPAP